MPEFLDKEHRDQQRAERLEAMRGWWAVYAAQAPYIGDENESATEICNYAVDEFCKKFDVKLVWEKR